MKVLVADKISPKGVAYLRQQPGFEVVEAYGSSPEKILELVKDVHAIAVRSETKITAAVFAAAPLLKVVGRAGVGVDNVDVEAATECATAAGYTEGQRNARDAVALGRCERVGFVGIASKAPGVEIGSHFRGMSGCCSHQCCTHQQVSGLE